ncbi:MAG: thiamine diphosphokinase [Bacteroidaceae bacterium]|nr:thiamine diphosphokinase [Bacteroidaceae bacterium]
METTDVNNDSWECCPKTDDCVVLANGDYPTHPIPLSILEHAPYLVCCDGAAIAQADIIIGDGDSVPEQFRDRLLQIEEQEDNDLTKATRYCVQMGWHRIAYLGCTGKREDHTLGNISLLMRYHRDFGIDGIMYTDHGFFTPCHGIQTFRSFPRQQVSIFNLTAMVLTSEGLRWQAYPYQEWWQGTLNESLANTFTIHSDGDYILYQTYAAK